MSGVAINFALAGDCLALSTSSTILVPYTLSLLVTEMNLHWAHCFISSMA